MERQVLSISQVNEYIRRLMDSDALLTGVAVKGEVSNYKVYPSGHHYFTLKDEGASLKCVMFRSSALRLRFKMENGMKIIAVGKISVYPRDGAYQLYCNAISLDGVGDLHAAFEQLKKKLATQGLFDPAHKKPIPPFPKTVGIVTSSAGAAVHDILRILNKRYPLVKVRLFPVRVQGEEAPAEIVSAIRYANYHDLADVLIVGRGGGSIEDLWAFNDERVAYAIYESRIPVISAVGHEPDVTISDYVADLRAATPSNAAELVVPDRDAILQQIDAYSVSMVTALRQKLKAARRHLDVLSASATLQSADMYVKHRRTALEQLEKRLVNAEQLTINRCKQRYWTNTAKLDAMSPLKVLTRGYALVEDESNRIIRSVQQVRPNDKLNITLSDGSLHVTTDGIKENL